MLRKDINFNAFMMLIKITAIGDQNDWFFISDQFCPADVCQDVNSQDFEVIFSSVSAL